MSDSSSDSDYDSEIAELLDNGGFENTECPKKYDIDGIVRITKLWTRSVMYGDICHLLILIIFLALRRTYVPELSVMLPFDLHPWQPIL